MIAGSQNGETTATKTVDFEPEYSSKSSLFCEANGSTSNFAVQVSEASYTFKTSCVKEVVDEGFERCTTKIGVTVNKTRCEVNNNSACWTSTKQDLSTKQGCEGSGGATCSAAAGFECAIKWCQFPCWWRGTLDVKIGGSYEGLTVEFNALSLDLNHSSILGDHRHGKSVSDRCVWSDGSSQ